MSYPGKGLPPSGAYADADTFLFRLLDDFPTPLVTYDLAVVRRQAAWLRQALPADATLLYSLKANPLPSLVAAIQGAGCGSEVSSPGELAVAFAAGPPREPVLYTGPGKSAAELALAAEAGAVISAESATEIGRALGLPPVGRGQLKVVLRLQAAGAGRAGLSMADGRQFGLSENEAAGLVREYRGAIEVLGFHCYLGSQVPTPDALLEQFGYVSEVVRRTAAACGIEPRIIDLGGGFPWPYATSGAGIELTSLASRLTSLTEPLRAAGASVWFESGRGLAAAAGRLLTTVLDVKERDGKTLVVVDAGVNILGGMSGLGRVLRPSTVPRNLSAPLGPNTVADIVGPLCTPLDRLSTGCVIAQPHVGDLLCVDNVGAYGTTAALSAFLSRPSAVEVIADGDEVIGAWELSSGHVPWTAPGTRYTAAYSARQR